MHWCLEETRDSLTKSLHIFIPCILIQCFYDLRFLLIIISQVVIQLRGKTQLKSIKRTVSCAIVKRNHCMKTARPIFQFTQLQKYRLRQIHKHNLKEAIRSKNSQARGYRISAFVIKLVTNTPLVQLKQQKKETETSWNVLLRISQVVNFTVKMMVNIIVKHWQFGAN